MALLSVKTLAISLFLLVSLAACGAPDPTPTPAPTFTPTPMQNLEARAEAAYSHAFDRNWLEQFQYISPRYRNLCDVSGYSALLDNFADLIIGLEGTSENPSFELFVKEVKVAGEKGEVSIGYLLDGDPAVVYDKGKRRWVLLNGQWWEEPESWEFGCVGWKLFE